MRNFGGTMGETNRIESDVNYIHSEKYGNSLKIYLYHHPDGVSPEAAAALLNLTKDKYLEIYNRVIKYLQESLS